MKSAYKNILLNADKVMYGGYIMKHVPNILTIIRFFIYTINYSSISI